MVNCLPLVMETTDAWDMETQQTRNYPRESWHLTRKKWDRYFACSLPIFYVLRKNEKNLSSRSLNILQNAPSNSVHLTSSLSSASVSNASLRVKVCKNDGNI